MSGMFQTNQNEFMTQSPSQLSLRHRREPQETLGDNDYPLDDTEPGFDDEELEDEGPDCKMAFLRNLKKAVDIFCIWDCSRVWIRISEFLAFIIFDPFTELFITLCILVNVIFLALDHYDERYDANGGM